jgi:hypothetical protein
MTRFSVCLLLLLAQSGAAIGAQEARPPQLPRGTITGEVLDAATLQPLPSATIVLAPVSQTGLLGPSRNASAFASLGRSVVTGPAGTYRFEDLPYGHYRLRVQRIGYKPITLEVRLGASSNAQPDARLSVGLAVLPVRLHALNIRAAATPSYGRMEAGTELEADARVTAARLRQQQFLGSDVRELTHPDVAESVTLGETDLFRAFHRLPGVATRDDYSAELWTRGARWDLTRIYFDDVPLFGPFHAFGLLSGIGTDAIGAALLHPGVRPASLGEGGGAVLDLRSRAGGGAGGVRGVGELSLLSGRLALDQRRRDGRAAWMVAARRSYLDWLVKPFNEEFPYHFSDLTARVDYQLAERHTLEASGLFTRDLISRDLPDILQGNRVAFGNGAGRVSLVSTLGRMRARHTVGLSHFGARIDTLPPNDSLEMIYSASGELPLRSSVYQAAVGGEIELDAGSGDPAWTAGYGVTTQRAGFEADVEQVLTGFDTSGRATRYRTLSFATLWAQRRWSPVDRFVVETGLRVDAGPAVANVGILRPMPRLQARLELGAQTSITGGVGRSFQYAQAVSRIERGGNSLIYPSPLWVMADRMTPALRADIATVGAERWLGDEWLATVNAYHRRSGGYVLRDPRPGPLVDRPIFVTGSEQASGLEAGVRKLAGRVTGSLGYTYGIARTTAAGFSFPSSQDRRHAVDATLLARVTRSLQLGAAYSAASGAPYTRYRDATIEPDGSGLVPPTAEAPNARRAPAYASLDLLLDWSFVVRGLRWSTFLQLRNALGRDNVSVYSGYRDCANQTYCESGDRFDPGLPRIPVIGFRATF